MTHEEIDMMWQQAMRESIKDGEVYIRYHFAQLVTEKALTQRTEPVIDKSTAIRIATALGWTPPKENT